MAKKDPLSRIIRRVVLPVAKGADGERVTRTKQEFKSEVDINELWARAKRGISPPAWMTNRTPMYGDFSNMPVSFDQAFAAVEAANAAFLSLPLEFRRELDHDPRNLDRAPRELFERFGLVKESSSKVPGAASGTPDAGAGTLPASSGEKPSGEPLGSKKGTSGAASNKAPEA